MITICSWNVNGIRAAVRNGFLDWLDKAQLDIVCLQEVRSLPEQVGADVREPAGYSSLWQPAVKKGYAGTAVYLKEAPLSVGNLGLSEFDEEGRVQALEFEGFTLVNAYFPNSRPERARIDYKLEFCEAIQAFCNRLRRKGRNVILCGDFNIAHKEIDLARPKRNEESPGFLPEERAAMTRFLSSGYVDTFREFNKEPGQYTWWSYRGRARSQNVGWRLDYHCVNKEFMPRVKESRILADVMGSDHCPVVLTVE